MGRCHKINIVAASFLQFQHNRCKLSFFGINPFPFNTDVMILAKAASQTAVRKKYGTGTICSGQLRFFTKVWCIGVYSDLSTAATISFFIFITVYVAISWTQGAGFKNLFGLGYSFLKQPGFR